MYNQIDEMQNTLQQGLKPLKETYGTDELCSILYEAGYRRQSEVAKEIFAKLEREIQDALRQNYAVHQKRIEKCGMDEFAQICSAKIHTLQGILDFIEELKETYEVDSDETN